ncbi:hypothetical protein FBU30_007275 [Linnemannia zychae]|nr:hypothetical protein FBU30_007275 [Linnemannia zychae]
MGIVLGVYFGIWALFSLIVRFLVPSPNIEPVLPTYTPSPIPVPTVLHSPSRPNAIPASSALRLHPTSSAIAPAITVPRSGSGLGTETGPRMTTIIPEDTRSGTGQLTARYTDNGNYPDSNRSMENGYSLCRFSPSVPSAGRSSNQTNSVTFQARPRGNTVDSTQSAEFPTFAAYRQSQHGNFEALAQRFKRAFAISQQTNERQQQQMAMIQSPASSDITSDPPSYSQTTGDYFSTSFPPTATNITTGTMPTASEGGIGSIGTAMRARSVSAASVFSDIAERFRSGSLFSRSNSNNNNSAVANNLPPIRTATDPLHYSHISISDNSDAIQPTGRFSHPVSCASYSSSPAIGAEAESYSSTTPTVTDTMGTLELLTSRSPRFQSDYNSISSPLPSSLPCSETLPTISSIPSTQKYPKNSHHDCNDNAIATENNDPDRNEVMTLTSSSQSQSDLGSIEKCPKKLDDT